MFAKLLKHEWKATRGLLGILTLAVLGLGVFGVVALRVILFIDLTDVSTNPILSLVEVGLGASLGLGAVALGVYTVAVYFILLYRFYKHKFTDEGYLTFTLPVKPQQIYWSSLVNMLIWMAISVAAVAAVLALVMLLGVPDAPAILQEVGRIFQELAYSLQQESGAYMALSLVSTLVSCAFSLVLPLACVTLGAVIAKKHKILTAFGAYYVITSVKSTLSSVAMVVPSIWMVAENMYEQYMIMLSVVEILFTAALTVGGYFLTIHLMKKKLNLP